MHHNQGFPVCHTTDCVFCNVIDEGKKILYVYYVPCKSSLWLNGSLNFYTPISHLIGPIYCSMAMYIVIVMQRHAEECMFSCINKHHLFYTRKKHFWCHRTLFVSGGQDLLADRVPPISYLLTNYVYQY